MSSDKSIWLRSHLSLNSPIYWYIMKLEIWRNLITGNMIMILFYCPIEIVLRWPRKGYNLKLSCFVCYEQSDWSKKVITFFYHIIRYSCHKVTRMWPIMGWGFFISPTLWHISKGEQVRDTILIRLVLHRKWNDINEIDCNNILETTIPSDFIEWNLKIWYRLLTKSLIFFCSDIY